MTERCQDHSIASGSSRILPNSNHPMSARRGVLNLDAVTSPPLNLRERRRSYNRNAYGEEGAADLGGHM
jgi:hypothetical protein